MPEQSAECLSWVDSAEGDQTSPPLAVILPSSSLLSPNSIWRSKVSISNIGDGRVSFFSLLGVEAWKPWVAALTAACEAAAEHLRALGESFGFVVMSLSLEATGFLNDSQDLGSTGAKESRRGETLGPGVAWREHAPAIKHSSIYTCKCWIISLTQIEKWSLISGKSWYKRDCGLWVYDIVHHRMILDEAVYLLQDMARQTNLPPLLISNRTFGMLLVPLSDQSNHKVFGLSPREESATAAGDTRVFICRHFSKL